MAAASTFLAAATTAFSVGKGISDMSRGDKIASQAMKDLEGYQRQDLDNAYAGMSVPTQGYEMKREQAMQTQAEVGSILSSQGSRGAIGGAISLAESTNQTMEAISAELTQAEFQLNQLMAEDEARIRGIVEQRESQDIAGLGARAAYGESLKESGGSRLVSTLGSTANLAYNMWGDSNVGQGQDLSDPSAPNEYFANPNQPDPLNFKIEMPKSDFNTPPLPWQDRVSGQY